MSDNPYEEVPYPTVARYVTHPEYLAALGMLFGMTPAPAEACRVLEIGCGNGNNLIPMAFALPGSTFTGIDLAAGPLAAGVETVEALGLGNITLIPADLRDIGATFGEFDYIIAAGVYSWIPSPARDRLLGICRDLLAPRGIAFISYNAKPGSHLRQMFREMMLYHTRHLEDAGERVEQARSFLEFFSEARLGTGPWRAVMDAEAERLLGSPILFHDDLAPTNDPVYFFEFAEHARAHGLQYLAEADLHEMFDHSRVLAWLGDRTLEREQYLDFLKARRFRQSLLCREEVALRRDPAPEQMPRFWFASPATPVEGGFAGASGVRISAPAPEVERVALALSEVYPLPLGFEELVPYAGTAALLQDLLFTMVTSGFAELHSYEFPCQETVTARPVASALARWQARNSHSVTTLCHRVVEMDETGRRLLVLLDGSRDQAALGVELARQLDLPGQRIFDELGDRLERMARVGLLSA